jgi:hypothetical protein
MMEGGCGCSSVREYLPSILYVWAKTFTNPVAIGEDAIGSLPNIRASFDNFEEF